MVSSKPLLRRKAKSVNQLPPLENVLACPVDGSPLTKDGSEWVSQGGRRYPTIDGIPIVFHPATNNTLDAMAKSRTAACEGGSDAKDPWCVETLGLNESQKRELLDRLRKGRSDVDPVVAYMIAATCGNLYRDLVGKLPRYPIPDFRLKNGNGRVMIDLGCNWGRWCFAAAREGFVPIGIDPQIGAVLAAKRAAKQLGVEAHFICADARYLPIQENLADAVFSYSVLQHLSREDVEQVINSAQRTMKPGAVSLIQMPNVMGARCFYQWAKRGFSDGTGFNVRYWTLGQLRKTFSAIGPVDFDIDCFFGIGLQQSDADLMPMKWKLLLRASEALRTAGLALPILRHVADSVYVRASNA